MLPRIGLVVPLPAMCLRVLISWAFFTGFSHEASSRVVYWPAGMVALSVLPLLLGYNVAGGYMKSLPAVLSTATFGESFFLAT